MIFFIPKSPRDFKDSGIDISNVSFKSIIIWGIAINALLFSSYYLADFIFNLINK